MSQACFYMEIKISSWYGRFGNNILQIAGAIDLALRYPAYFKSPKHKHVDTIELNPQYKDESLLIEDRFFKPKYNIQTQCIIQDYIRPKLINIPSKPPADDDVLFVHLRSGDVFRKNPHPFYVQNPLCYFLEVMSNFRKTIVISEGYGNPIVEKLSKQPNTTIHVNRPFEIDLSDLLSARNLCLSGVGTIGPVACALSHNIENIYHTNLCDLQFNSVNLFRNDLNLSKYITPGEWTNSEHQRNLMIEYDCN